ncbi:hypothetical protein SELMODRAFT_405154 [Selaginella moellendorffii]|uniref:NB-ARC domain-containing protein n=1 Tax=Selaginella moellendorffii TaxID=88036 RepID=D8QWE2_SELML|nr:hypothetical protein SELMODRAFT_405154 [Selaginella moellendorffii]
MISGRPLVLRKIEGWYQRNVDRLTAVGLMQDVDGALDEILWLSNGNPMNKGKIRSTYLIWSLDGAALFRSKALEVLDRMAVAISGRLVSLGPEFLWEAKSRLQLYWPSIFLSALEPEYYYIGREHAKGLYQAVLELQAGNVMQILGSKGCGKHRHGYHRGLPAWADLEAERKELLRLEELRQLVDWDLLVVVDDWDKVETDKECCGCLKTACRGNMLVRISSSNSRERYEWETSDKADDYIRTQVFDGPYTETELQTWIAHVGLDQDRLDRLDYFTGRMPRLVRLYAESQDDEDYKDRISRPVVNKIETEMTTKESVEAALKMVTSSTGLGIPPLKTMKLFCFDYFLCPYLRHLAEKMIKRLQEAAAGLFIGVIRIWGQDGTLVCLLRGKQDRARCATNMEKGPGIAKKAIQVERFSDSDHATVCKVAMVSHAGVAQNPVSPTTPNNCTNHKKTIFRVDLEGSHGSSGGSHWTGPTKPYVKAGSVFIYLCALLSGDEVINSKIEDVVEEVKTITNGNMAYDAIGGALTKELFDAQELTNNTFPPRKSNSETQSLENTQIYKRQTRLLRIDFSPARGSLQDQLEDCGSGFAERFHLTT